MATELPTIMQDEDIRYALERTAQTERLDPEKTGEPDRYSVCAAQQVRMRHAHTPIEKLVQLSDILGVTLDYLVMRTRDQKQPLRNVRLIERLREVEGFDSDDQEAIIKVIDAMIVKRWLEGAVAPLDQQQASS
jgi:hypothetical protein